MSRYPPPDYRGPKDRSRSPPRFTDRPDRRPSAASAFDNRPPALPRNVSDTPRGPRSQFDTQRPPLPGGLSSGTLPRPGYASLRDAPPLGSADRGRPYREREYERRDRPPSPRERSLPRNFTKDPREFPPRDLDISRSRRDSRDGPLSAVSNYPEGQPFNTTAPFRGGLTRGRGRGDSSFRGGRGGRSNLEERDLFRRERSPPPRWGRDLSRESREPDRRPEERRFERRDEERRNSDWMDREREREPDRTHRDQFPPRLETRPSNESVSGVSTTYQSAQAPPINPARLAMIESTGGDTSVRRPSIQQETTPIRDARREQTETPSYLNGRAETTANRYGSRGSSPPLQAPPVPAFTLSFAPPAASSTIPSSQAAPSAQGARGAQGDMVRPTPSSAAAKDLFKQAENQESEAWAETPYPPRVPPSAPRVQLASPPPADTPRAPRAQETDETSLWGTRLHGVRSLEDLPSNVPTGPGISRPDVNTRPSHPSAPALSPTNVPALPTLTQPVTPHAPQIGRYADLSAPTGPRATRMSPALASVSPRPPFASPRSDIGTFQSGGVQPRMHTPPRSAPSGPRNRSYSVSPKVANPNVPTAPKGNRGPPLAPRGLGRGGAPPGRTADRFGATHTLAPPSGPKAPQWNQWRREGPAAPAEKTIPAKRDFAGDEKGRLSDHSQPAMPTVSASQGFPRSVDYHPRVGGAHPVREEHRFGEHTEFDKQPKRQPSMMAGHSAAQSFFGKRDDEREEDTSMSDTGQEVVSTSEEDESDTDNGLTLFNAKFERQKRQLESQMVDLSSRHYRATTPLESIARLNRISVGDMQKFHEQKEHEMDVDGSPVTHQHHPPATTRSSDSGEGPDLLTPKGEDDHRVAIRSSEDSSEGLQRLRRPTPEQVNLPYLLKEGQTPFNESNIFKDTIKRHEDSKDEVLYVMEEETMGEDDDEVDVEGTFADYFRRWREDCETLDRVREEQEKLERQQSLEPGPEVDVPTIAPINPAFESRRLHKFNSEYEFELVLKQSEETARREQERQDREARKNQADMEKEAKVPDQLTEIEIRHGIFIDLNRYRDPESLTAVFSYQPPVDTFTETEQHVFVAAFKETPKKWGEIASLLPGRSYEDCIRHYYANKWDGRFRDNRTKKLKAGGKRGRGGGRGPRGRIGGLMADLARAEDLLSPEMSEKGRPRRAAAPTNFGEKEEQAKTSLLGPSPAKKAGNGVKTESNGETGPEKPGKRQKRTGEKPGRKAKSTQPLLAAAPQASPGKTFIPGIQSKEELAHMQKLEEASLLANLQSGHSGMPTADMLYPQESFMQAMPPPAPEDPQRPKPPAGQSASTKQGASSYWSVPEQNDFVKYIGHFGRDFAAIAAHMGTKTQTMIKNHYQRQVDSGNRPDLEKSSIDADERRNRGEELGAPPSPTPIPKRKYENVQIPAQRALAPQKEDSDETPSTARPPVPKHASPPQYPVDPRFTSAARDAAISASRVAPSPLLVTSAAPVSQGLAASHSKPMQHPLGSRITFLPDTRGEPRPGAPPLTGFRATQEPPQRAQPSQTSRAVPATTSSQYMRELVQEQEKALHLERQFPQLERIEQTQRPGSTHGHPPQGSPPNPPLHNPMERKPAANDRGPTSPRSLFSASNIGRPLSGSLAFGALGPTPFSSLVGRSGFNTSPTKREDSRPSSVPTVPPAQPPPASAAPSEPKRSNVMSLLNSEPEEPKPPKRESLPSALPRAASPQSFSQSTPSAPLSGVPAMRREPSFGQPSMPQSHFQRGPFGQQSSTPTGTTIKHEPSAGGGSLPHPAKPDWAARVMSQTSQASPPTPTLERDVRPYYHHRSILGSLGTSRINPSPPPLGHSRQSSITGHHSRDQSQPGMLNQAQSSALQPTQSLQPNPYASQQPPNFGQLGQNQSQHAHNSSVGGPFPSIHHRTMSRDDQFRQEQLQRDNEDKDRRWRAQREAMEIDRRREDIIAQRQQDQERERERLQGFQHGSARPPVPPRLSDPSFASRGMLDLRGQARMDTEMAMREEQDRQRQQQEADRRRQEELMREREQEEFRRRQEESSYRRTPLGGGYGLPPPAPRR